MQPSNTVVTLLQNLQISIRASKRQAELQHSKGHLSNGAIEAIAASAATLLLLLCAVLFTGLRQRTSAKVSHKASHRETSIDRVSIDTSKLCAKTRAPKILSHCSATQRRSALQSRFCGLMWSTSCTSVPGDPVSKCR